MTDATAPSVDEQIAQANAGDRTPVVFIHGLWLLAESWRPWAQVFDEAGYAPVAAEWPGDPATVAEAHADPDALADHKIGEIGDHLAAQIGKLTKKPAVIGHSFGGMFAQMMAGRGLSAATVAIDPAPFRGVLPLPLSALKSSAPVLGNPLNRKRAVALTFEQFRYAFANALEEDEAKELFEAHMVAGPGVILFQAAAANLNPFTEAKVDRENPDRGPLLVLEGGMDHTVPTAIAEAEFKLQEKNPGVTEYHEFPDRGHALTIDDQWREVADTALAFVKRFT